MARMIFFSSDQVYFGNDVQEPHREDELLTPCRIYGKQKQEAEQRCLTAQPDTVALRMSWMFDNKKLSPREHDTLITSVRQAVSEKRRISKTSILLLLSLSHISPSPACMALFSCSFTGMTGHPDGYTLC